MSIYNMVHREAHRNKNFDITKQDILDKFEILNHCEVKEVIFRRAIYKTRNPLQL